MENDGVGRQPSNLPNPFKSKNKGHNTMSFGSGKLYEASNRFSPSRGRNVTNSSSPPPRWHASLSPERRVTKGNGENTSRANASVNQYYEENSRNRYFSNAKPDTSRSLDDDIISFLNTSPRPESFQSRLHQSVDNGWGTSEIYKNNEVALDETPDHDGDSFLEEIRQEDEGLYKLDQTLLDGSFKGTSRAPNLSGRSQVPDGANPRIGSPQQRGKTLGRDEKNKASKKAIKARTIYSTRPSPHVKKRRERYLMNRSRNTHPYSSSSIVDAYSNKNKKKDNLARRRISSKQQRLKDSRLAQSKRQINSTHNRSTSKPSRSSRTKFRKNAKVEPGNRKATKSKNKTEKKRKKRKKINQSQLILDRSAAPGLPPSPARFRNAKVKVEAWSNSNGSDRKVYRVPSSKFGKSSSGSRTLERPSSAGARLTSKYNLDVDSEEVLNKKIKTITKQKRNIKSLKLRKRGMENSIAALQKEVQARDMHIKELRKIIKKKDRELVVARGAKATEAANTSGILNLSSDSIRSVGSQSYRDRKDMSKLQKSQQKLKSEIKELRRREQRAVEIHGALRNTIDKLRNEKDAYADQIDDLKSTIRSLKRSLEAERQYNKELIRTEFGENEAMNLQEEKINSRGINNKVTNRILRQEISRLKSLLEVSRGKVKDMDHELNHFKGENENLRNTNDELRVQMKNLKMKDKLLAQESETAKNKKERNIQVKSKEKDAPVIQTTNECGIEKLMKKKIDDDKATLSEYQRLKSMYDRVQGNSNVE